MVSWGRGRERDSGDAELANALASLRQSHDELRARLRMLEELLAGTPPRAGEPASAGLRAVVARLDRRVQLLDATLGSAAEPSLTTRLAALAALPAAVAELTAAVGRLEAAVSQQQAQLDRHQGTLASLAGPLPRLLGRLTALEQGQQAISTALATSTLAQQESRATLDRLLSQRRVVENESDSVSLLIRLLQHPAEAPPLLLQGERVCFAPRVVEAWLAHAGLARAEVQAVRRGWRKLGLVPAGTADSFNVRVRLEDGALAYVMAVPAQTYAELHIPLPPLPLATAAAMGRPSGSAPHAAPDTERQPSGLPTVQQAEPPDRTPSGQRNSRGRGAKQAPQGAGGRGDAR